MTIKKRPDFPNALHHVMARGVAKQKIFLDHRDYTDFLNILGVCLKAHKVTCFAWVLMPNHFHLLVQRTTKPIYKFMQSLLISFAMRHNLRNNRVGHLFQNRFKSILCQSEGYFLTLVKYIHQNPLRAGLVKDLDELFKFPWSGHRALMGGDSYNWYQTDELWRIYGEHNNQARENYLRSMLSSLKDKEMLDIQHGVIAKTKANQWKYRTGLTKSEKSQINEAILGDQYFIRNVLSSHYNQSDNSNYKNIDFQQVIAQAAVALNVPIKAIVSRRRELPISLARGLLCAWGMDSLSLSVVELSLHLDIHVKTVYKLANRGRELIAANEKFLFEVCCLELINNSSSERVK